MQGPKGCLGATGPVGPRGYAGATGPLGIHMYSGDMPAADNKSIEGCARRLLDLLGENAGDNEYWPIKIKADDDISSELCQRLNDLQDALKQKGEHTNG